MTVDSNLGATSIAIPVAVEPHGAVISPVIGGSFGDVELTLTSGGGVSFGNLGNAPVSVSVGTSSAPQFVVTANDAVVGGGEVYSANVAFSPDALGPASGTASLTITGVVCGARPTQIS